MTPSLISDEIAVAVISILGLVLVAVFGWVTSGRVKELREELTEVEDRVGSLEKSLARSQAWSRILEDYSIALRLHITEGKPPPPPPWPPPPPID